MAYEIYKLIVNFSVGGEQYELGNNVLKIEEKLTTEFPIYYIYLANNEIITISGSFGFVSFRREVKNDKTRDS